MKQKLYGAAAMVAFILFGVSCSQEQSELSLSSVKQEVTISAKVTYDAGVEADATKPSGYVIANAKPAAGRKVFIEIPYAQYKTGAAGNKIFETITDDEGLFSISIPTTTSGITASIRMEEFVATYNEFEKMVDGKPVFKSTPYNYSYTASYNGLKPGAGQYPQKANITYNKTPIDPELYSENVTFKGQVNLAYETGFRKGAFKAADKATVEFKITYDPATAAAKTFTFGTTTDAQGNYVINLPLKSLSKGFQIDQIRVLGIGQNRFTHYTNDSTAIQVDGAYQVHNIRNTAMNFKDVIDGVTYDLGAKNLLFTPSFNDNVTTLSKPENWEDNLIGWAAGMDGFNESYSNNVTLTGNVYMPVLTSFGVGSYTTGVQTITIKGTDATSPYFAGFTVITDKNGKFEVELPVKDDKDLAFTVALTKEVQPFTFISSKGVETVYYKGSYKSPVNIKAEDAKWYELGDYYFKYTPDSDEKTSEWNANLIGWYRSNVYKKEVPVTGKMLFAVEESYGKGTYVPQSRIVNVQTNETTKRTFAIKTDANGSFAFNIPLKNENDQPSLSIVNAEYETNEYVHYNKPNESKLLVGKYTSKSTVYDSKDEKEAWNKLGTTYMYIKKSNMTSTSSTYVDNLAGWYYRSSEDVIFKEKATATGSVVIAQETGFVAGDFMAAKNKLIKVKIGTSDYIMVLSDKNGAITFDVPIKNIGDEISLTVDGADIAVEDFVHYVDADLNTKILSGNYKGESVKESGAQWNELGTLYYTFIPATADKPALWDTYFKNIYGWKYKKGYQFNTKTPVKGTLKMAKETAARVGTYVNGANMPVTISFGGDTYATATNSKGVFEVPVLQKFVGDEGSASFTHNEYNSENFGEFDHFRKVGTTTIEKLEGKYEYKSEVKDPASSWYQLGTIYYKYTPTAAAISATNDWNSNLAGWVVPAFNQVDVITIQAEVKKCVEIFDGTPKAVWQYVGNTTAKVTVDGVQYPVPVVNGFIDFNLYVEKAPANVTMTIVPDNIKEAAYTHWENSTTTKVLLNKSFKTCSNINGTSVTKSSEGNIYKPQYSAKMKLDHEGEASNWTNVSSKSVTTEE